MTTKIERPFIQLTEIFRKSTSDEKEMLKYVFEKSDNISLWIIGLSIGGISIIANNISNIQSSISPGYLKLILVLLAISVSAGIIYRSLYLYFFVVQNNIIRGIEIAFTEYKMMDTESFLTGNETFEEIIEKVQDGTGNDLSFLLPNYNEISDTEKDKIKKSVVDYYLKSVDFAKKDQEAGFEFIADTYTKFYGLDKQEFLQELNNPSPKVINQYKTTLFYTKTFYLIYILTFIAALFAFVIAS